MFTLLYFLMLQLMLAWCYLFKRGYYSLIVWRHFSFEVYFNHFHVLSCLVYLQLYLQLYSLLMLILLYFLQCKYHYYAIITSILSKKKLQNSNKRNKKGILLELYLSLTPLFPGCFWSSLSLFHFNILTWHFAIYIFCS